MPERWRFFAFRAARQKNLRSRVGQAWTGVRITNSRKLRRLADKVLAARLAWVVIYSGLKVGFI